MVSDIAANIVIIHLKIPFLLCREQDQRYQQDLRPTPQYLVTMHARAQGR